MTTRTTLAHRLRTAALATVLAVTSFAVTATPAAAPASDDPISGLARAIGEVLAPRDALAAFCASNPTFTGRLTASSSSTAAVSRITNANVYAYISKVNAAWSCTAYLRYSGIGWNTNSTTSGRLDWGDLTESTSVACNYVVGSTDYVKGNPTTDCPDTDAEYALQITLSAERVYQQDSNHNSAGDFSFIHSDCGTLYGGGDGEALSGTEAAPESFAAGNVDNRPGSNCDALTIDGTNTSQTITYDNTAPTIGFDTPDEAASLQTVTSAAYTVAFDANDAVAKFGGANGWTLSRQIAPWDGAACGTFTADAGAGAVVTGTTAADNQTSAQTLASGSCYRWTLAAVDQNGKSAGPITSGTVRRDATALLGTEPYQRFESWGLGAGDALSVNVATGNVLVSHPVVSLPIRGGSFDLGLTYNSGDTANVGMGPGWRLNVLRRLTVDPATGDVTFTDGDGSRHVFDWTGSAYVRPATIYATLTRDTGATPDRFTLTYRDQSKDLFDELATNTGYLVAEQDRFGNAVTFGYSGTNLATATDPAGRTVSFTWDTAPAIDRLITIVDWANVSGGVVQASGTGNRTHRFFYDGTTGRLTGWADPLNTNANDTCPADPVPSHLTCLVYATGTAPLVTAVRKLQTYETAGASALATATRTITTAIAYRGGDTDTVTDAEQQSKGTPARTTFTRPVAGQTHVVRPGTPITETKYGLITPADSLARVHSMWRLLGTSTWIEQRTTYDASYPTEPASVIENYVNGVVGDGTSPSSQDRTTSYSYVASSMGLVSRMTEPLTTGPTTTRTTDYTYNSLNDVTQRITALDGSGTTRTITRYCYHASTCNTTDADPKLWRTIENFVDGTAGNGTAPNAEDVTTTFGYDAYGQQTRETRLNCRVDGTLLDQAATGFTYDTAGNLTAEIRNYSNGSVTSPGDDITPNATTGARTDLTTAHTYDTAGNPITTADPRRAILAATGSPGLYDYLTTFTFDPLGQQLSEKTPTTPGISITQKTATTVYDELGNMREVTDFGGLVTGTEYDRAGRATQTLEDAASTSPDVTAEATYDAAGHLLTTRDRRQYDTASLGVTASSYDELGRVTSVTEASGSSPDIATITATTYDALNRTLTESTGDGTGTAQLTTYTYDLGGRVVATDDEFACTTKAYDYRDLATSETSGLAGGTCASGADTRTVTHTYDGLGRLTRSEVTAGAGTGDRTYDVTLDSAGWTLTAATRVSGVTATTTFTLDPLDETLAEARADGSTAKTTYDAAGNPVDRCHWKPGISVGACLPAGTTPWTNPPSQVTSTTYDARNNRLSLADGSANTTTTYDPDHNYEPAAFYIPTASGKEHQTLYGYDTRHRLSSITHQVCAISTGHSCSSTVATGSDTYAYDDADNRTQVVEANGATSADRRYCYDGLNRLRARNTGAACTTTSGDETYTYDDAGNRLTAPGATFTYDAEGQLASCSPSCATLAHDTAGRISALSGWTYVYDAEDRLITATETATSDRLEFSYDGEGHRTQIREVTAGVLTRTRDLSYQGSAIVEEKVTDAAHPSGAIVRSYTVTEAGQIVSMTIPAGETGAGTYLVTWSGHGDALALWRVNGDGTLTLANSYTYSTWGTPTIATHNGIADLGFRFLYVGAADVQWDDFSGAGMLYMHARHYRPAIGRFLQPDPSAAEANLYWYAGDNPITKADPSGEFCWFPVVGWQICIGAGQAAAAALLAAGAWATSWFANHPIKIDIKTPASQPLNWSNCWATYHHYGCVALAQTDKKKLESLRRARDRQEDKLEGARGEDVYNHWKRVKVKSIEEQIKTILRRHPQWRESGDP